MNNVTLVATATADPAAQGSNSFFFTVEPALTVDITAVTNVENETHPLLATVDTVLVSYGAGAGAASLFASLAASGAVTAFEVGYVDDAGLTQRVAQLQAQQVSFKCPYLSSTATQLTVYVELRVNNVVMANKTASYPVRLPSATAMASAQEEVLHTTDPVERTNAASNIAAALTELPAEEQERVGLLLLDTLTDIVDADSAGDDVVDGETGNTTTSTPTSSTSTAATKTNQMLTTLDNVLTAVASADEATRTAFAAKATNAMNALASNVQPSNVNQMFNTLDKFPPSKDSAQVANKMASSLSDQLPAGAVVTAGNDKMKLVATKSTGASLKDTKLSPSNRTNISMSELPNLDPLSQVAVNVVESTFNSLESSNSSANATSLASNIVAINLRQTGRPMAVQGLPATNRIQFSLTSAHPETDECSYFDEAAAKLGGAALWAKGGVEKVAVEGNRIFCATEHLTSFAAIPAPSNSSSSGSGADGNREDEEDYFASPQFLRRVVAPTVIAAVVILVVVAVSVLCYLRRRRAAPPSKKETPSSAPDSVGSTEPTV